MTIRDTIAGAVHEHLDSCDCGSASLYHLEISDAVIAAIRALPVEDQAELIGGGVETSAWQHWPGGGTRRRARGPWTA